MSECSYFPKSKTAEILRIDVIFKSNSLIFLSAHANTNVNNACHWKVEIVSFSLHLHASPSTPLTQDTFWTMK